MAAPWLVLQLADAAFPAGGFAHSSGLEASLLLGGPSDVEAFLDHVVAQTARASLPFVRAACAEPTSLPTLDDACDAMLLSSVANRASRAQGRAFASAARRIFDVALPEAEWMHHAPVFGAVFGLLRQSPRDAAVAFVHGTARAVLSAAVRLGAIGPLEAQRVQAERATSFEQAVDLDVRIEDAAQTAPLLELYGALHDRLDGRLFQS